MKRKVLILTKRKIRGGILELSKNNQGYGFNKFGIYKAVIITKRKFEATAIMFAAYGQIFEKQVKGKMDAEEIKKAAYKFMKEIHLMPVTDPAPTKHVSFEDYCKFYKENYNTDEN